MKQARQGVLARRETVLTSRLMSEQLTSVLGANVNKVSRIKRDKCVNAQIGVGEHPSDYAINGTEPSILSERLSEFFKTFVNDAISERLVGKYVKSSLHFESLPIFFETRQSFFILNHAR